MISKLILILIAILCASAVAAPLSENDIRDIQSANRLWCDGKTGEANAAFEKMAGKFPDSYEIAETLLHTDRNEDVEIDRIISGKVPLAQDRAQFDRLRYVNAMLLTRSDDIALMDKILNFTGDNLSIEAHRIYERAFVKMLKRDYEEAKTDFLVAVDKAPLLTVAQVSIIFAFDPERAEDRRFLLSFESILQKKYQWSTNPIFTGAVIRYARSVDGKYSELRHELLESSYQDCPKDDLIASYYAGDLLRRGDNQKAKEILKQIIGRRKFPSSSNELNYGIALFHTGEKSKAKEMFERVIGSPNIYISKSQREAAARYIVELNQPVITLPRVVFASCGFLMVLLGLSALVQRRRKNGARQL